MTKEQEIEFRIFPTTGEIFLQDKNITHLFLKWDGNKKAFVEFFDLDLDIDWELFTDDKFWINGREFAELGDLVGKIDDKFYIIRG